MDPASRAGAAADVRRRGRGTSTVLTVVGSMLLLGGLVAVVLGFSGMAGFVGGSDEMTVLSDGTGMTDMDGGFAQPADGGTEGPSATGDGAGRDLALMAGGGFAMVLGLAVVGFTRVAAAQRSGGWSRVVVEHGSGPETPRSDSGLVCGACGRRNDPTDRFCGGCGHALG